MFWSLYWHFASRWAMLRALFQLLVNIYGPAGRYLTRVSFSLDLIGMCLGHVSNHNDWRSLKYLLGALISISPCCYLSSYDKWCILKPLPGNRHRGCMFAAYMFMTYNLWMFYFWFCFFSLGLLSFFLNCGMCVWERETDRDREGGREGENENVSLHVFLSVWELKENKVATT